MAAPKKEATHMADPTSTRDKILDRIDELVAQKETHAANALGIAKAANELAEAWAWLGAPSQPHGGSS